MESQKLTSFKHTGAQQFVITRKRKKYRFARFNELANCFHLDEWVEFWAADSNKFEQKPLVAEIGAGSGLFLLELARLHPEKLFVAVDIKSDRLYQGARDATEGGVNNIFFVRSDIACLSQVFCPGSVDEIWLTFPDPYPRKSDAKHRLTSERYLKLYQKVLSKTGQLHFKTDSSNLFDYSLSSFRAQGWRVVDKTCDLHASNLPDEYKIMTVYERRFVGEGLKINYLGARPPQKKLTKNKTAL